MPIGNTGPYDRSVGFCDAWFEFSILDLGRTTAAGSIQGRTKSLGQRFCVLCSRICTLSLFSPSPLCGGSFKQNRHWAFDPRISCTPVNKVGHQHTKNSRQTDTTEWSYSSVIPESPSTYLSVLSTAENIRWCVSFRSCVPWTIEEDTRLTIFSPVTTPHSHFMQKESLRSVEMVSHGDPEPEPGHNESPHEYNNWIQLMATTISFYHRWFHMSNRCR